ncbi:MAG: hypothetical protein V1772_07590 [Chloroflexota bacterium]
MRRNQAWRAVAVGATVVALLVAVFSFAPTRALARQVLGIFRVKKFAVVQVNPDPGRLEAIDLALQDVLFQRQPEMLVDEPMTAVATLDEARQMAGFDVRLPTYVLGGEPLALQVKGRSEMGFALRREGLAAVLELAGMDPKLVPSGLDVIEVRARVPATVMASNDRLHVVQLRAPTIEYPEGIAPGVIGEAGLRMLGMAPAEARRISQQLDWANTLLLPVPAQAASVRETTVAGVAAVAIEPAEAPGERVLLWAKDDVVYLVAGRTSMEALIQVAESMF